MDEDLSEIHQERVQFGKRISQFQDTQFQLADMHTRMEAAKYLVYSAAMKKQNHEPYSADAAMAKLFAAEAASDVTAALSGTFGGGCYTRKYPVGLPVRDARSPDPARALPRCSVWSSQPSVGVK